MYTLSPLKIIIYNILSGLKHILKLQPGGGLEILILNSLIYIYDTNIYQGASLLWKKQKRERQINSVYHHS